MAHELRGQFLETCDCSVMCPCWFDRDPDENECTGLVAWYVEKGEIGDVDVSGLTAVSISHRGGHRRRGRMRVALFVDEHASDEQEQALADAFTGKLGGPLAELAELTEDVESVELIPSDSPHNARCHQTTSGGSCKPTPAGQDPGPPSCSLLPQHPRARSYYRCEF